MTMHELLRSFAEPPDAFRPTPLYWWSGDDVRLDRLEWQLDKLAAEGVGGTVVGYSHTPASGVDAGDPEPLSERWWELFAEFVRASGRRGLSVGMQEYVVLNHVLIDSGSDLPPCSAATLVEQSLRVVGGARFATRTDVPILCAYALRYTAPGAALDPATAVQLAISDDGLGVDWSAPDGEWLVCVVSKQPPILYGEPVTFDALRPGSAEHVIKHFYGLFPDHLGDLVGTVLTTFFQDEFDLGITMPMWSRGVPAEFARRKGYELGSSILALWHDLGPASAKFRIDYADVIVTLLEENYFRPVHEWHRAHSTILAMDQSSRGDLLAGRKHYADYARTMRWFDAPGNDDPHLEGPRNLFGFKVNSSIAHLYSRPIVWNEAFHSSGWGVTPAQVLAGLNEDFAYGVTHVCLHGLYYSTRAGWWEWAAPDFHFRQPYWAHLAGLWTYLTRSSFLLSQGSHRCDVVVLDPVTDLEATRDDGASAEAARVIIEGLVRAGCDTDLIDFESLERAHAERGTLSVSGEAYRVLILPECQVVRESTIRAAEAFVRAGGVVLAWGAAPVGSEATGSPAAGVVERFAVIDAAMAARGIPFVVERDTRALRRTIRAFLTPDFESAAPGPVCLHRRVDGADLYWVTNPLPHEITTSARFRATGHVSAWDPFTGAIEAVADVVVVGSADRADPAGPVTSVPLTLASGGAVCLVISAEDLHPPAPPAPGTTGDQRVGLALPLEWTATIVPTLDNDYADFAFPAGPLGVQRSTVQVEEIVAGSPQWVPRQIGDGIRMLVLGPVRAPLDLDAVEAELAGLANVWAGAVQEIGGQAYRWRPYRFSETTGLVDDPLLKDWNTGPHGLKGGVPDDFIDLGPADLEPRPDTGLDAQDVGVHYFVWTTVAARPGPADVVVGSRSAFSLWIDGAAVASQAGVAPAWLPPWSIQDHRIEPRTLAVTLSDRSRILARFTQGPRQRLRAYLAVDPPTARTPSPYLHWWSGEHKALSFDPSPSSPETWSRIRFDTPPGTRVAYVVTYGRARAPSVADFTLTSSRDGALWRHDLLFDAGGGPRTGVELVVEETPARRGSAAIAEAIRFETGPGPMTAGLWSERGLDGYSGRVEYTAVVDLAGLPAGRYLLDLGDVAVSASVSVNGHPAGTRLMAPFVFDLSELVVPGENSITIDVANTLAEFYSAFPSPFAVPAQVRAGLLGPVTLERVTPADPR